MSRDHLNPDVDATAARHVAHALGSVNPRQRGELLRALIRHAEDGLDVIYGRDRQPPRGAAPPERTIPDVSR